MKNKFLHLIFVILSINFIKLANATVVAAHPVAVAHSTSAHVSVNSGSHASTSAHPSFSETHSNLGISHEGTSSYKNVSASDYNSPISGKSYIGLDSKNFILNSKLSYSENKFSFNSQYRYRVNKNFNYNLVHLNEIENTLVQNKGKNSYTYNLFFGNGYKYNGQDKGIDDKKSFDLSILNKDFYYVNDSDDGDDSFNAFDLNLLKYTNYKKESYESQVLYMTSFNNKIMALLYPSKIKIITKNKDYNISYELGTKIMFLNESELLIYNKDKSIVHYFLENPNKVLVEYGKYDYLGVVSDVNSTRSYFESMAIWISRNESGLPIILYRSKDSLTYNFPTFSNQCVFLGSDIDDNLIELSPIKCQINKINQLSVFNNKIYLNTNNGIYSYNISKELINPHSKIWEFKQLFSESYKIYNKSLIFYYMGIAFSIVLVILIIFIFILIIS